MSTHIVFYSFPSIANKLRREINNKIIDQELCYVLCRRFIAVVEMMLKYHKDQKFVSAMYSYDYDVVKDLALQLKTELIKR